ncbi:MAG TPA: amidohydrolase family protein, partial [Nitriliruptorales bacterium]
MTGLLIRGDRIEITGDADELADAFPEAERHDLGNAVVVPGLHDAHQHITHAAENLLHLDLSADAVSSSADVLEAITAEVSRRQAGSWIRGSRYDETKTSGGTPVDRFDLDEVAPEHPVLITQVAGHWGIVNSRALELMGLDDLSEPPPGGEFGRDGAGRLNGILYENALIAIAYDGGRGEPVLPPTSQEQRLAGLGQAIEMFHAAGLTSVTDAFVGPADLDLLRRAATAGSLTMRVNYLVGIEHDSLWRAETVRTAGQDVPDPWLNYLGVKTFVDGAIAGRTCNVHQPFEGTGDHGMQVVAADELHDMVRSVHDAGSRIGVHANGDRAIEILLDQ